MLWSLRNTLLLLLSLLSPPLTCPTSTDSAAVKRANSIKFMGKLLQKLECHKIRKFNHHVSVISKECLPKKLLFLILHSEGPDASHGDDDGEAGNCRHSKSNPVYC